MPEVRRRGLSDQLGVGADRTQRGAGQGGGIGPTIARLQQAYRSRSGASVTAAAATLDGTTYSASGEGEAQITDMPAGIYALTGQFTLEWDTTAEFSFATLSVVVGSTEVAANTGSVGDADGTGSTALPIKVSASTIVDVPEGASIAAEAAIQSIATGTSTTTITAVRLGDTN